MLQRIYVKNMALIDEADVDFSRQLNIMTGETGAGKSIIIGSVSMALGGKVSKDIIRHGEEYALAELHFEVKEPSVLKQIEEMDVPMDGQHITISRRITGTRSIARVNGEMVSLAILRQIASLLIDIHGQHEHQSLLHKEKHLEILDQFSGDLLQRDMTLLKASYRQYINLKKEKEQAITDEGKRQSEISFLSFQIEEIENANLIEGEEEQLDREFRKMSHARQMMEQIAVTHDLTGYDSQYAAGDAVGRALHALNSIAQFDEQIEPMIAQLSDIDALLNDFNRELANYKNTLVFDETVYREMEERLNLIHRMKKKYGGTIEEILCHKEKCEQELERLNDYEHYLEILERDFQQAEKELLIVSDRVTKIRQQQASILQKSIKEALIDLNFLDVQFEIQCEPLGYFTENGQDRIEMMISTNPGEQLKSIGSVASGGELSRIMLAIKSVLADADAIETLIFDEIDTGISGRTAQKVSEKMAVISRKHQVICITHLPQIAAMADAHYVIEKNVRNERTITKINKLSEEASIAEIARLLGGVEITDAVISNACEMKKLAQSKK